jgi:outer membrane protein
MRICGRQAGEKSQSPPKTLARFEGASRFAGNVLLISLFLLSIPGLLFAQQAQQPSPLTLQQAVNIALEKNPARKVALADTRAASADVKEARSFLLPHVTFSETATDGNDPVYVFGSKLRQQRFTTADFALNVLNTPTPFGNFATRFAGTWNLFDSFASWRAVDRAERLKDAAGHQLERTDQEIVFHVVDSYYAVLLAKKQLDVADQAMNTAQAILDRSKDRFENGVVVESDYLSAQVRLATRTQELIRAQNNLALARAQLSTTMGVSRKPNSIRSTPWQKEVFRHRHSRKRRSKR